MEGRGSHDAFGDAAPVPNAAPVQITIGELEQLSRRLLLIKTLPQLYGAILGWIDHALSPASSLLYFLDASGSVLQLQESRRLPDSHGTHPSSYPVDAPSLCCEVLRTRRTRIVPLREIESGEWEDIEVFRGAGQHWLVGVPVEGEEIEGVLLCSFKDKERSVATIAQTLEFAATQLGHARVRLEAQRRSREIQRRSDAVRDAMRSVCEDLSLEGVLQRLTDAARKAVDADYAALGIVPAHEEQPFHPWVFSGVSRDVEHRIGRHPRPIGLLSISPQTGHSVRCDRLREHPAFHGLPAGHPDMGPFMSVPVRRNGQALGNLYLARRPDRRPFTPEHQETLELLAEYASLALDHARDRDREQAELLRERRLVEELRDAEERLTRTLEDAPIGMAIVDRRGRFLRVNRALCDIVDYRGEQLVNLRFQDITHPDDLEKDLANVESLLRGDIKRYDMEKRYIRRDGSIVDVHLYCSIVRRPDGEPLHLIAQILDVSEQRAITNALRASEKRLARSQRIAHLGSWEWDLSTNTLQCSAECVRQLGCDPSEAERGLDCILDRAPEDDRERLRAALEQAVREHSPFSIEHRLRQSDGTERIVLAQGEVQSDPVDSRMRLSGTLLDVTEQRQAEENVRRQERLLRAVLDALPVGVWIANRQGVIENGNPAGQRIWAGSRTVGIDRYGEYVGFWPDTGRRIAPEEWAAARAIRKGETSLNELIRIQCFDGTQKMILNSAIPLRDERGEISAAIIVNEDITERYNAEQEREALLSQLATERSWLQAVFDYTPTGIMQIEVKPQLHIMPNRRALQILGHGFTQNEGPSQYLMKLHAPDGRPLQMEELPSWKALHRGESTLSQEVLYIREDGQKFPGLVNAAPIRSKENELLGVVITFEDITVLKELERLREEWMSVVAHDLRQPVAAIELNAELLRRLDLNPQALKKAEHIQTSAARLKRMIADLLDMSRIEAHRLVIRPEKVELQPWLTGVIERAKTALGGCIVHLACAPPELRVTADPARLEQVMDNLLSNAAKNGEPNSLIDLQCARVNDEVIISVRNRGPGVPATKLPTLFERFERAGQEAGPKPGLGLGLYITKGLVEAQGGRIWVESTPGEWTTFSFTLPVWRG